MATSEPWLTPREAGALLGVGPDRVSQLVKEGALKAFYSPGGQIRIRREELERFIAEPEQHVGVDPASEPSPEAAPPNVTESEPPRPKWMDMPPWKRRVHEAEAALEVLKIGDERERYLAAQTARAVAGRKIAEERAAADAEVIRLRGLRQRAMQEIPYLTPAQVRAEVARNLERRITSQTFPAGLEQEHVAPLLKAEVERLLRPWRSREARRERTKKDASEREQLIAWAIHHVRWKLPRGWDSDIRRDFECEVKAVLDDEVIAGMEQSEANAIAMDVLDDWLQEEE